MKNDQVNPPVADKTIANKASASKAPVDKASKNNRDCGC